MKKNLWAAVTRIQICVYLGILSSVAAAQGTGRIVESQGITPGQASSRSAAPSPANSDALSLLLGQIQQLQTEVQALRGMVEEQSFELRRLQQDSLSRYSSTDERLSSLESRGVASAPAVNSGTPAATNPRAATGNGIVASRTPTTANPNSNRPSATTLPPAAATGAAANSNAPASARPGSRGSLQPAVLSEQQLYQMAYDSVINSNFERSIAEFDQYLSIYPEGRFVTNAKYWKGQAFLYLNRYDEARVAYEQILDEVPPSPKLPDAMYGLALAYQGLGNIPQARRLLNEIKRRFPNTGTANLADTRLLSLE